MANKTFTLSGQTLNDSVSVGDTAYYATITTANGFDQLSTVTEIGDITAINTTTSVITIDTAITSSPNLESELFAVSSEVSLSSK